MAWAQFKDDVSSEYSFFIYGNNGKYDSNGYYLQIPPYKTSLTQFRSNITLMKKDKYIDLPTMAVFITGTLYNPQHDYYISILQLLEMSTS
jgi:hypothetical protein